MSESPVIKLRKRLSLKHYASDSPQTPKNNKNKNVYSTPINRKRCAFDEESPSQDAFSSPITFSQEVASRVDTDVTWEWNSPKRQNISESSKRKPKSKLCLLGKKTVKEKIVKKSEVEDGEKGGFFKFAEELKNIKLPDTKTLQEDVLMKDLPVNNSNEENLAGNYSNFFNDSDFDSIIMQCNEEPNPVNRNSSAACSSFSRCISLPTNNVSVQVVDMTQNFQRTVTMPTVLEKSASGSCSGESLITSPSESKKSESYNAFFDDSDEFDTILMQCSQKVEEQLSQNTVPDLNKKSFIRHYSMPGSPSINKKIDKEVVTKSSSTQIKNFPRTISMPIRGGQFKVSPSSTSSSSNSSTNSNNRCTLKEIEEKKQKALRKLQEKKKLEK